MAETIKKSFFMKAKRFKEIEEKIYTEEETPQNHVYVFSNREEFEKYFIVNGLPYVDSVLVDMAIIKTNDDGTIIARKATCDLIIKEYRNILYDVQSKIK